MDGIYTLIGLEDLVVDSYEITVNVSDGDITASETTIINIEEILVAPVFVEPEKELVATEDELFSYTIVVTDNKVGDLGIEVISSPSWLSSISRKIETTDGIEGRIQVEGRPENKDVTKEEESYKLIIKITEGSSFAIATYNIKVINTDDKVRIESIESQIKGVEGLEYRAKFKIEDIDSEDTVKTDTLKVYVDNIEDWLTGEYNEDSKEYIVRGTIGTELAKDATQSVEIKVAVEDLNTQSIVDYKYDVEITGINDSPVITGLNESYKLVEEIEYIIPFTVNDKDSTSNLSVSVTYTDVTKLSAEVVAKAVDKG